MTDKERAERLEAVAAKTLVDCGRKKNMSGTEMARSYANALLTFELLTGDEEVVKEALTWTALGRAYMATCPEMIAKKELVQIMRQMANKSEEEEDNEN